MLLFDCSYDLKEILSKNKLLYWLHFLQTQVESNANVILIGTKYDILYGMLKNGTEQRLNDIDKGKYFFM